MPSKNHIPVTTVALLVFILNAFPFISYSWSNISGSIATFYCSVPKPSISGDKIICGLTSSDYNTTEINGFQYDWHVKRGSIISGQGSSAITVQWDSFGTGSIILNEISGSGCTGSDSLFVEINVPPKAGLSFPKNVCQFFNVAFTDSSTHGDNEILDFGDGSKKQILPSPFFGVSHIYLNGGIYKITQVVNTITGCSDTARYSIKINPVPYLNWMVSMDTGRSIYFNEDDTTYPSYLWKFGDGGTTNTKRGGHTYLKNGSYDLSLLVTSDSGCSVFFDSTININLLYSANNVWVYPNPFSNELTIGYTLSGNDEIKASLYDETGRNLIELLDEQQSNGKYTATITEKIRHLPAAVYYMKIFIGDQVFIEKVVKGS